MTDTQIDVNHINRLFAKFQQRIGEVMANNIALEAEVERLTEAIKTVQEQAPQTNDNLDKVKENPKDKSLFD